jgi:hypothetical protein
VCRHSARAVGSYNVADPVKLVPAWKRDNGKIGKDAVDFWRHLQVLPPGVSPEQRVNELCAAAYAGDELIGVSTVSLGQLAPVRCRVGFFRCSVNPAHIHRRIAWRLAKYSRELLEQWSKSNPDGKVLGMVAVLENPNFDLLGTRPIWRGADLTLIGYNQLGQQIRLAWFDHARTQRPSSRNC